MGEFERYDRQLRLDEIGPSGQAAIATCDARVHGSDGALIEALYLHRAGVERLSMVPRKRPTRFEFGHHFEMPESRAVAAGAWRALQTLRHALGLSEERSP